jgi:hypothetical protein
MTPCRLLGSYDVSEKHTASIFRAEIGEGKWNKPQPQPLRLGQLCLSETMVPIDKSTRPHNTEEQKIILIAAITSNLT